MFGDPRTMPGGQAQKFAAAIIGYTEGTKYEDTKAAPQSIAKLAGHFKKNKTYPPNHEYMFRLNLVDNEKGPKGWINNYDPLIERMKQHNLLTKEKSKWRFGTRLFATQKAMVEEMQSNEVFFRSAWRSVVNAHCGVIV